MMRNGLPKLQFLAICAWLSMTIAVPAHPLDQWTVRSPNGFNDVTYGNGQFIAVGGAGLVGISPDGKTWSLSHPAYMTLLAVTYGAGQFVTVGATSLILTSPDGLTWTLRNLGTNMYLNQIEYGNSVFVGLGYTISPAYEYAVVSSNGADWTPHYLDSIKPNAQLTFGNGLFVHVCSAGTNLLSTDGVNWWLQPSGTSNSIYTIRFANGQFLAMDIRNQLFTSVDGTNWTFRTTTPLLRPEDVAFGNGFWVVVGRGYAPAWSSDLTTWHVSPTGSSESCLCFGNGTFVGSYNASLWQSDPIITLKFAAPGNLYLYGPTSQVYRIDSADGLGTAGSGWQPRTNITLQTSPTLWTDPDPAGLPQRFYRTVVQP